MWNLDTYHSCVRSLLNLAQVQWFEGWSWDGERLIFSPSPGQVIVFLDKVNWVWGRDADPSSVMVLTWRRSCPHLLWGQERILKDLGNREKRNGSGMKTPLQMGRLHMAVAEYMCCRVRKTWVRVMQAVWPCPGLFTSLTLSLLFCQIRIRTDPA